MQPIRIIPSTTCLTIHRCVTLRRCHSVVMESLCEDAGSYDDADLVELAYEYITSKHYPAGCTENKKRTIRKKSKRFVVWNGELCYKMKLKKK